MVREIRRVFIVVLELGYGTLLHIGLRRHPRMRRATTTVIKDK
jgi:hypothetical protein